jgi:site-specific recombinase XerD
VLASPICDTGLAALARGYAICAAAEGKSPPSISIVLSSLKYLDAFLSMIGAPRDVTLIRPWELRNFILYLREKPCFSGHPYARSQNRGLSSHTINTYLRSLRTFWSWLVSEEIITDNPFKKVKIPRASKKIMATFSEHDIKLLLGAIDTQSAEGYRDYVVILTLLDTGLRVSELGSLLIEDVKIEEGTLKVLGKGNRERVVPIGSRVQKGLWCYISRYRRKPVPPVPGYLFLTRQGSRMTKNRIEAIVSRYGKKAGLSGVRCSPHTLRHTAAVSFLRNGGDVFSLQRMLGHRSLEMTRRYLELSDSDLLRAHLGASPVDNLDLKITRYKKR